MNKSALKAIKNYNMIEQGDEIVIGVSGGADSIALSLFLLSIKNEYSLTLRAAHINHGIRGEEAARDEEFVREFCENNNMPLDILHFNVPLECEKTGESEEECGRRIRYDFFKKIAKQKGKIATAHNLNDNAETVLLNIIRGTGNKGICGIPPVRDNIIRPLILSSREQIEEYLNEKNQHFITDSTNLSNDYKRNKIRNTVFPVLNEINPSVLDAFERLVLSANEDEEFIEEAVCNAFRSVYDENGINEDGFFKLPIAIKKRVISKFLKQNTDSKISSCHINDVLNLVGQNKEITTVGALKIQSKNGFLNIAKEKSNIKKFQIAVEIKNQIIETPLYNVEIQILSQKDLQNFHKQLFSNAVDCDKIKSTLFLRSRADGDEITLIKRNVTKSLKKLFNESKIENEKRNGIAVLADENDVIWVDGFGVSKKFSASKNSEKVMLINKEDF